MSTLIPKHWDKYRLKDVFELRNGYTPSKNNPEFWDGGKIPWFRMEDIRKNGRILSDSIQHISEKAIKGYGLFKANSFILATTATIGEHAWLIADSLANQRFTNLKIRKSLVKEVQPKFLFYYFFIIDKYCHAITRCTTFSSVNMDSLKMFTMYFPSLAEQQRIADYFDIKISEIDRQVSLLTSKRDAYLRLKKSIINRAVTKGLNSDVQMKDSGIEWIGMIPEHWEVKRMKDIFRNWTTGITPDSKNFQYFEIDGQKGYTWVTISDFSNKYISKSDVNLSEISIRKFVPSITRKGSLMFSFKLSVGKLAFATKDLYTNEAIVSIPPTDSQHLDYYYYILPMLLVDNATENIYGAKMLNQKKIANMLMVIPPLSEQQAIAAYLDEKCSKIDAIVANLDKQISKYAELKRSLIDEVITGKRVV